SPILAVADFRTITYADGTTASSCVTQATETLPFLFFLMTISVFFLLPFIILLALYARIARELIADAPNKHSERCNRRHLVIMLGTVVLAFFVCLLPFRLLTLWIIISPDEALVHLGVERYYNILYFCRTMHYLNSAVNPVLYNLMSSKFRDGFSSVCGCFCWCYERRPLRKRSGTILTTSTSASGRSKQSLKKHKNVTPVSSTSVVLPAGSDAQSPILVVASYQYEEYFDGSIVAVCLTQADSFWPALFFISSISVFFLIPLAILVILYTIIAKNLMENPMTAVSHGKNGNNIYKYRRQVVVMLGAVVLSFFVCLMPFRALTLWIIVVPPETIMSLGLEGYYILLYFCRIMLYINSAINPILYNLMSSKFREGFMKLLGCHKLRRLTTSSDGRKSTFRTTSSTLSSNTDSFWRRYSTQKAAKAGSPKHKSKIATLLFRKETLDDAEPRPISSVEAPSNTDPDEIRSCADRSSKNNNKQNYVRSLEESQLVHELSFAKESFV
ncbi:neurotensin receptor type 2-like, partial [Ctenocephalides felis]|uniref:neurotensin receptor type 2-like n=1 Tax=Ctenocephalides felis TaxID=7515 RepID=UPI000E6E59C4